MSKDVFRPLSGTVQTDEGIRTVSRDDELPEGTLPEERKRLKDAGIIGEPFKTPDEVAAEQADQARSEFEAQVEATNAEAGGDAGPTAPTVESSDEEVDAFIADATGEQVVAAAGDDAELAARLVEAEQDVRGTKARKSVLALTESDNE